MIQDTLGDNVELIGEFPSVNAEVTSAPTTSINDQHHRDPVAVDYGCKNIYIQDVLSTLHQCKQVLPDQYQFTRVLATEILVFVITDLDRLFHFEHNNAHILAYGMKGFTLLTDTYRKMLLYVLSLCKAKNLYIPLVTSDSAFQRVAVRSASNEPLTLLQLQKDVWSEAKKTQKSAIISHFKNLNKFNSECVNVSSHPIVVHQENRPTNHTASLSEHTRSMVVQHFKSGIHVLDQEDDIDDHTDESCTALNFLSDEMLETVDEAALEAAERVLQDTDDDFRIKNLELWDTEFQTLDILNEDKTLSDVLDMFENMYHKEESKDNVNRDINKDETMEVSEIQDKINYKITEQTFELILSHLRTDTRTNNQKWQDLDNTAFIHMFDTQDNIKKHFQKVDLRDRVCVECLIPICYRI